MPTIAGINGCMKAHPLKGFSMLAPLFPLIAEPKFDGGRVGWVVEGDSVEGYSVDQKGKFKFNVRTHGDFSKVAEQIRRPGRWLVDTEMFGGNWSKSSSLFADRSADKTLLRFIVLDAVNLDEPTMTQIARRETYGNAFTSANFEPVEWRWVWTPDDVKAAISEWTGLFEGVMLKQPNAVYGFGKRSWAWIKIKPFRDVTVRIVGFHEGENRNTGRLGSLACVRIDTGMALDVGGGLKDEHRDRIWADRAWWLGKTLDVKIQDCPDDQFVGRSPNVVRVNDSPDPRLSVKLRDAI